MDTWVNEFGESKAVTGDCRICDKPIGRQGVYLQMPAGDNVDTFAQIYLYLFGVDPNNGIQGICRDCSKVLISTFKLRKMIEDKEKVLSARYVTNGKKHEKRHKKVEVKKVKQELEEVDPIVEPIVVKVEPTVPLEMDVSDDEASGDGFSPDISSDDEPLTKLKKKIKKKSKAKRGGKVKVEDHVIQCPLCEYKSNVKDNYQKHVYRVHKRQEMKCDGCEETFHLIYLLEEHRKHEHEFDHEYKVITTPMPKVIEKNPDEEEVISCPLCDYKSNVKGNYQKHVLRIHNRQELKCDGCEEKFHLVYLLEEHRRGEHDFTHPYEVDDSLKLKTPERRFGQSLRAHKFEVNGATNATEGDGDEKDGMEFKCPLCPYSSTRHSRFSDHFRKMHENIEMPCDGCTGKFHLFYRLLEHRKLDHKFENDYVVPEAIVLEDQQKKEQRRIDKGQHFPCPCCDRWFREKRNVAKHLKTVHGFIKYRLPKGEIKEVKQEDGTVAKKKYVYPVTQVVCNFCGKLFSHTSLENHIRNIHPEHRDPYICAYCGEPAKTKTTLCVHFYKCHKLDVKITKQQKKTADNPVRDTSRYCTVKTPQGTVEYMCRYCPEKFPFKISRKRHEIHIHTLEYPFTCGLCDKKFVVKFEFKRHLARHAEGKRLSCSRCQTCGQHFTKRKLLERHMCTNPNAYTDSLPEHLQQFAAYR